MAQQSPVGQGPLIHEVSRSHSDPPHLAGLLWMGDQPDAETSTWQHTTPTRAMQPFHRRDSNTQSHKQATADPRLRPRGHLDLQCIKQIKLSADIKEFSYYSSKTCVSEILFQRATTVIVS